MIGFRILVFAVFAICACSHLPERKTPDLHNPFSNLKKIEHSGIAPLKACPAVPPPVRDVYGTTYYSDTDKSSGQNHHSVVDPVRKAQDERQAKPLLEYSDEVYALADHLWASTGHDQKAQECFAEWLGQWAVADALLGDSNIQGKFYRNWTLAGVALAYLRVESLLNWNSERKAVFDRWIRRWAQAVENDLSSHHNNHSYWAGLSVMASGIILNDRSYFEWGVAKIEAGIREVDADGFLPLELARGRKALHYHNFSLKPLIMSAFLAQANDVDFYALNGGALHRLAASVLDAPADNSTFRVRTGFEQEPLPGRELSWAEIYAFQFPERVSKTRLNPLRPLREKWLGGDMTQTFSAAGW